MKHLDARAGGWILPGIGRGTPTASCAELGPGQTNRLGVVLAHGLGDQAAERLEQLGACLEAVLVEVVALASARAEDEVALQVSVLAESGPELLAVH